MKRILPGVVLALAVALMVVSAVPPATAATSLPTWSSGDYWVYTMTGTGGGAAIPNLGSGGTVRYDVVGTDTTTLSFPTYHTRVNFTMQVSTSPTQTMNLSLNGDEWFRQSDLAPAKLSLGATIYGFTVSVTAAYSPPPDIHWPLTAGDTWSVTSTVSLVMNFLTISNSTTETEVVNQTVLADTSITVAAGTFTTTPLKQTIGMSSEYSVAYWSSTAGNWVSQRSYDSSGGQTGSMDLKSYNYQGGSFLNMVILGLPLLIWLILVAVIVIAVVAVVLLRRRRPAMPQAMPPIPPSQPPMQPGGPEQQPPGPPPPP